MPNTLPYRSFSYSTYDEVKRLKNKCHDCQQKITKPNIMHGRSYCEVCYNEIALKCGKCESIETGRSFIQKIIEEDNEQTYTLLCPKCYDQLIHCQYEGCNMSFTNPHGFKCELCEQQFCKVHVSNHRCSQREPEFLWRSCSNSFQPGNIEEAQFIKSQRCVGIEIECVNGDPDKLVNKLDRRIGIMHDGSLTGDWPLEIQTPPSSSSELEKLIHHATKILKEAEYKVNKSCSVHIHVDCLDFVNDPVKIFNITSLYYAVEPLIFAMLPKSRRDNKYALPLKSWIDETRIMALRSMPYSLSKPVLEHEWYKSNDNKQINHFKSDRYDSSRYNGFNLHSFFAHGHLELRYHHGTLNATKIINWINLHLLLMDWAINKYNKDVVESLMITNTPEEKLKLVVRHILPKEPRRMLRRYIKRNLHKFKDNNEDRE